MTNIRRSCDNVAYCLKCVSLHNAFNSTYVFLILFFYSRQYWTYTACSSSRLVRGSGAVLLIPIKCALIWRQAILFIFPGGLWVKSDPLRISLNFGWRNIFKELYADPLEHSRRHLRMKTKEQNSWPNQKSTFWEFFIWMQSRII